MHRFIKPLSQPYIDLANTFALNNSAELNRIINKQTEVFTRDQNMGLVKQVASVLYKTNIQRLTKTFLTLSLSDVASRVGLPGPADAEKYILHMVSLGVKLTFFMTIPSQIIDSLYTLLLVSAPFVKIR